jgi:hypothetical protein
VPRYFRKDRTGTLGGESASDKLFFERNQSEEFNMRNVADCLEVGVEHTTGELLLNEPSPVSGDSQWSAGMKTNARYNT